MFFHSALQLYLKPHSPSKYIHRKPHTSQRTRHSPWPNPSNIQRFSTPNNALISCAHRSYFHYPVLAIQVPEWWSDPLLPQHNGPIPENCPSPGKESRLPRNSVQWTIGVRENAVPPGICSRGRFLWMCNIMYGWRLGDFFFRCVIWEIIMFVEALGLVGINKMFVRVCDGEVVLCE